MLIIEFFSGDFQGQEGVRIMHQCALYNPKYGIIMTGKFKQRWSTIPSISNIIMTRKFKQLMVNDSFNIKYYYDKKV